MSDDGRERFERLFASSYEPLLAYAVRRCASGEDAADVVAETFATAWRRIPDVPDGEQGRFWLYATARRVIANQRRGSRRRAALHDRLAGEQLVLEAGRVFAASTPLPSSTASVAGALLALDESDRELLQLTAWEGLTPTQVGTVLGCSAGAARVRLHRARRRLRDQLDHGSPPGHDRSDGDPTCDDATPITGGRGPGGHT